MKTYHKAESLTMLRQWPSRVLLLLLLAECLITIPVAHAQESATGKILILYYSRTGNTRMTCEELQKELNAQLIEIKDLTDRSGSWGGLTGMLNTLFNMETGMSLNTLTFHPAQILYLHHPSGQESLLRPYAR